MVLRALTICVDFGDFLAWALPQNRRHFDSFTVVTTEQDAETRKISERHGAAVVLTDRLHNNGSTFDRGAAINDGLAVLERLHPDDWFCIVDADVILPWNLGQQLARMQLDRSCIYGIERGVASDRPISGFFQLFHGSLRRRYREGHKDAGYTDTWFAELWPAEKRITLPGLKGEHLCRHGENWRGRVSERLAPPTHVVTPDTDVEETRKLLCGGGKLPLPRDWRMWPNVQQAYRTAMAAAVTSMPRYPQGKYSGRGIVIAGGGKYFASTYVTLRMLRHVGCTLPLEVWYFGGKGELLDGQMKFLEEIGASCIDADAMAANRSVRILKGWELKTFATLHSRFEHVLYLDADSYPCRNPEFLFDRGFREHGAMFFPDAPWMKLLPEVWQTLGIAFRDERTIESGQFLIDKQKCWQPLALTYWMNQRSDYYFQIGPRKSELFGEHFGRGVHGDKDLFHLAWRYLSRDYAMPEQDYTWISPALVQYAPDGDPVFIHRARRKFTLDDDNFGTSKQEGPKYEPKLPMEDVAHGFLKDLQRLINNQSCEHGR